MNQNTTVASLLEIIHQQLPLAERERLDYLMEKNQFEKLTEVEQEEFLQYADRLERLGAEKARALVKLAQIRNVEPKTLLDKFFPNKNK